MKDDLKMVAFNAISDAGRHCFDVYRCSDKQMSQRPIEYVGRYYAASGDDAIMLAKSDHAEQR